LAVPDAVGNGYRPTAVITSDAVSELKLRRGDNALAIIKSTEVMIAREVEAPARPARRRRKSR
jgi:molybdopterin-binding protein